MKSTEILRESFRLLFQNIGTAILLSIIPVSISAVIVFGFLNGVQMDIEEFAMGALMSIILLPIAFAFSPSLILIIPVLLLVGCAAVYLWSWFAVAWHRKILLDEPPTIRDLGSLRAAKRYCTKIIGFGLIYFGLGLLIIIAFHDNLFLTEGRVGRYLLSNFVTIAQTYVGFRIALAFTSCALGEDKSFGESFSDTKHYNKEIFVLSLAMTSLSLILSFVSGHIASLSSTANLGMSLVLVWFMLVLGLSAASVLHREIVSHRTAIP